MFWIIFNKYTKVYIVLSSYIIFHHEDSKHRNNLVKTANEVRLKITQKLPKTTTDNVLYKLPLPRDGGEVDSEQGHQLR